MKFLSCLLLACLALPAVMVVTAQDDDKFTCAPGTHAVVNSAPDADPVAPDVFRVTWHTTVSNTPVVIEVVRAWSPVGVDRFHQLIRDNFFDCSAFFRVVPGFVVQLGLASEPELTEKWDTKIVDDPVVQSNLYSYISFATSGANSRTSQIFINIADNPGLDGSGFSPFGRVVSGMKVVEQLYNPAPRSSSGLDQTTIREQGNVWILDNYPETDIIALTEFNEGTSAAFAGRAAWMAPVAVVSLAVVWF